MPASKDTLPPWYFYFFWLVEPTLSLAGAIYALFRPGVYGDDLLPDGVEPITSAVGSTVRGGMLIGALGSCFALLALVSFSIFPVFKRADARLQEQLVRALLIPLAVGDVIHITVTLIPLPSDLRVQPWRWTQLIHGNVDITFGLLAMRLGWLAGIARYSPTGTTSAAKIPGKVE